MILSEKNIRRSKFKFEIENNLNLKKGKDWKKTTTYSNILVFVLVIEIFKLLITNFKGIRSFFKFYGNNILIKYCTKFKFSAFIFQME